MRDLFVNGCSFATGWHGGEYTIPSITSKDVVTDTISWVQHFANMNDIQNCWNHSIVAKPIDMTVIDSIGFCEQYYNKYGTFKNLFVVCELTDPSYRQFDPVTLKGLVTDKSFDDDYSIVPIAFRGDRQYIEIEASGYKSIYVKLKKDIDYLSGDQFAEQVPMEEIAEGEIARHDHEKNIALQLKTSQLSNLELTLQQLTKMTDYFHKNDIRYIMTWTGGRDPKYKKILDAYYKKFVKTKRLVSAYIYAGVDFSLEHSVEPVGMHPDQAGHLAIAEFLTEYITMYNLTQSPQLDLLNNEESIN